MNKLSLQILLFALFFTIQINQTFAQVDQFNSRPVKEKPQVKRVYLGVATGIDNFTGILGPSLEVNLVDGLSIYGGAGVGTWGYKASGGVKYYLNYPFKWAFNAGFSHATGVNDFTLEIETEDAQGNIALSEVTMDWKPSNTVNLSAMIYWRLGKSHRFNLEMGYAVPVTDNFYAVKQGGKLSEAGEAEMKLLQPGGLIIGAGFSFGIF